MKDGVLPPILVNKPAGVQLLPLTSAAGRFTSYPSVATTESSTLLLLGRCRNAREIM
jgi:hypothetical protein